MKKICTVVAATLILFSCGSKDTKENAESGSAKSPSQDESAVSSEDQVKYEQYMVAGETLYLQYCSMCHQSLGTGLAELYPPLKESDFLKNNFDEAVCIIKNGKQGEIQVNGKTYNQVMPAQTSLTDLEIAEVLTYVSNSWGNKKGFVPVTEVSKILKDCQPASE